LTKYVGIALAAALLAAAQIGTTGADKDNLAEQEHRPATCERVLISKYSHKEVTRLLDNVSQLERKLALARSRLGAALRLDPCGMPPAVAKPVQSAIVDTMISNYIGVNHCSADNIRTGDVVLFVHREPSTISIVGEGFAHDVSPSHCAITITNDLAGIVPGDEIYLIASLV